MDRDKQLDEFIALWKKLYGQELCRPCAAARHAQLLDFYRLVHRPLPDAPSASEGSPEA